jgi:hypothetical protein
MWQDLLTDKVTVVIAGGILTLLTTLLTSIVTNFFTARHDREARAESARRDREAQAESARRAHESAQDSLQADLIKQFVDSQRIGTVRENLRFLADVGLLPTYAAGINKYLDSNPDVAPQLGDKFEFSGETVSETVKERIRVAAHIFKGFLEGKGFSDLGEPETFFYSKDKPPPQEYGKSGEEPNSFYVDYNIPNSFYVDHNIFIHKDISSDVFIALREYTHYALFTAVGSPISYKQTEVESALADYLPATFLNSSAFGSNLPKNIGLDVRLFRNIDKDDSYDAVPRDWFSRGIVWAAALWSCRQRSGRVVDDLILPLWREAMVTPDDEQLIVERFGAALVASSLGQCFIKEMSRRNLPWNNCEQHVDILDTKAHTGND